MPSFYDFAVVCQSLSQTQSRLQMAEEVGTFLAALDVDEAEIAARFMVGRAVEQGEEKRLQISGRAIWKIVAEMTDSADQGEDIFTAAEDFGEAVEMTLKLRGSDPEPTLTIRELNEKFAEIAAIEGRHARNRKLDALRELFARAVGVRRQVHREDSDRRDAPRRERGADARGDRKDERAAGQLKCAGCTCSRQTSAASCE